jgi:hypothetical protein
MDSSLKEVRLSRREREGITTTHLFVRVRRNNRVFVISILAACALRGERHGVVNAKVEADKPPLDTAGNFAPARERGAANGVQEKVVVVKDLVGALLSGLFAVCVVQVILHSAATTGDLVDA